MYKPTGINTIDRENGTTVDVQSEQFTEAIHTCLHWVTASGPKWAINYQNTHASADDANCNCNAAHIHAALHIAGIPSITVSARPKNRSILSNPWHQFVAVKIQNTKYLILDMGKQIKWQGTLEEYLATNDEPMELASIGPLEFGTSEYGETTFNNPVAKMARTWHNTLPIADIPSLMEPRVLTAQR